MSTSSQLPSCASSSSSIRFAPAEKFGAVVADDERGEVRGGFLDAGVQHLDRVAADRVHLRVELDAQHAVAEVDEARAGVLADRRRGSAFAAPSSGERARRRCRVELERPELPAEPPAHRPIDVVGLVGDLPARRARRSRASGRASRGGSAPTLSLPSSAACGRARPTSSIDRAASSDGSRAGCFGRYSIVVGSSVRISPLASFL